MPATLFIIFKPAQKRKTLLDPSCLRDIALYTKKLNDAVEGIKQLNLSKLDTDTPLLNQAFSIVYDLGIFDLHTYDTKFQELLKLDFFTKLTPYSGSLCFLGIQILAANRIMQSNQFPKAQEYYQKRCGIIINHLRAPITIVDSIKSEKGYKLSGRLNWASGYKIFDTLVVGFHFQDQEMQAIMPFIPQEGCHISETDETFVANSMNTVHINLDNYEVLEENIISAHPIGFYTQQKSLSKTIHFALYALGVGAIETLDHEDFKEEASQRLNEQKANFMGSNDANEMDLIRIDLFNLVQQIITTGMILHGGSSILASQNLQRYYRELIMFNSNGLNNTLKDLFKGSFLD